MYVCVHIYVCVYVHICMYVCIYLSIYRGQKCMDETLICTIWSSSISEGLEKANIVRLKHC